MACALMLRQPYQGARPAPLQETHPDNRIETCSNVLLPMKPPEEQPSSARHSNPNRTRDHLANERTYLSWIRTAVALLGFGVVVVRLRYLLPPGMATHGHGWELGL